MTSVASLREFGFSWASRTSKQNPGSLKSRSLNHIDWRTATYQPMNIALQRLSENASAASTKKKKPHRKIASILAENHAIWTCMWMDVNMASSLGSCSCVLTWMPCSAICSCVLFCPLIFSAYLSNSVYTGGSRCVYWSNTHTKHRRNFYSKLVKFSRNNDAAPLAPSILAREKADAISAFLLGFLPLLSWIFYPSSSTVSSAQKPHRT